jgi:hypothetical protein
MYIFTCDNTFEDMMCCIYHAWEKALKVGHGCVRLEKRGEEQISLFDEYIKIKLRISSSLHYSSGRLRTDSRNS